MVLLTVIVVLLATVTVPAAPLPAPKVALSSVPLVQVTLAAPSHQLVFEANDVQLPAPSCAPAVVMASASHVRFAARMPKVPAMIARPMRIDIFMDVFFMGMVRL